MKNLFLIILLSITGCTSSSDQYEQKISDLEEQLEQANDTNQRLRSAVDESNSALSNLRSEIDRLNDENWRDVVPDIESSADEADTAIQDASIIADEYNSGSY